MKVDVKALQGTYKKLDELLGTENMLKVYHEYRGTQLNLSMKLYDRQGAAKSIRQAYPTMSIKELSDQYGFSQRWVKKVISDCQR